MDKVKEILGYFLSGFTVTILIILAILGLVFSVGGIVHFIDGSTLQWYEIASPFIIAGVVGVFWAASECE